MKRLLNFLVLTLTIALFATCKREPAQWDVGIVSPVATASLNLEDMVPGDYIVSNTDSSLRVVYQNTIYTLPIDSLLKLPDTTFVFPQNAPLTIPIPAGQQFSAPVTPLRFAVEPAQLTRIVINSGTMQLGALSTLVNSINFNYGITNAKKNNVAFNAGGTVPAAVVPDSGKYSGLYDLAGYDINLTGNGSQTNILPYSISAITDPNGTSSPVTAGQLMFKIYTSFLGIKPDYIEGYFGTQTTKYGPDTAKFDLLKNIVAGTLDLQSINLGVTLENSIGADIRANIKSLKSVNTKTGTSISLQHPVINSPMNIDRATGYGYNPSLQTQNYTSTQKTFTFNNGNSNLAAFVSNLPDQLEYKVDLTLNPIGNISGGKDFIYRDAGVKINIDLDMPLTFKSAGLTLVDTIDYNISAKQDDIDRYQGGSFKLFAYNGFPIDAQVQLLLLDEFGVVTDTLFSNALIAAAPVDANFKAIGQQATMITFPVNVGKANNLVHTKKVVVKAAFDTKPVAQYMKMYSNYKLDLKLTSDFNFRMKL